MKFELFPRVTRGVFRFLHSGLCFGTCDSPLPIFFFRGVKLSCPPRGKIACLLLRPPALLLVATILLAQGCGGGGESELDTANLIEQYEAQSNRHDPENFVEVDLGSYFITRRIPDKVDMLLVRFHLFAVTPRDDQEKLVEHLAERNQRMRDSVISIIQRTKIEDFSEPSMNWMRAELIPAINRVLKTSSVRDVIFTEFAIERS